MSHHELGLFFQPLFEGILIGILGFSDLDFSHRLRSRRYGTITTTTMKNLATPNGSLGSAIVHPYHRANPNTLLSLH